MLFCTFFLAIWRDPMLLCPTTRGGCVGQAIALPWDRKKFARLPR